jgi:hypothetical protein
MTSIFYNRGTRGLGRTRVFRGLVLTCIFVWMKFRKAFPADSVDEVQIDDAVTERHMHNRPTYKAHSGHAYQSDTCVTTQARVTL